MENCGDRSQYDACGENWYWMARVSGPKVQPNARPNVLRMLVLVALTTLARCKSLQYPRPRVISALASASSGCDHCPRLTQLWCSYPMWPWVPESNARPLV